MSAAKRLQVKTNVDEWPETKTSFAKGLEFKYNVDKWPFVSLVLHGNC